ncbi:unnamed protein product [Phytophthora fragariaefolia]|uniref:Unnamed protein product n=1 Tax=Phytophthora fragariaefolia TaxID=1490495 RepID=A0A9W6Y1Q7_9STRA|nr:unnamed protein product [Phytophthora fragariaefolia]
MTDEPQQAASDSSNEAAPASGSSAASSAGASLGGRVRRTTQKFTFAQAKGDEPEEFAPPAGSGTKLRDMEFVCSNVRAEGGGASRFEAVLTESWGALALQVEALGKKQLDMIKQLYSVMYGRRFQIKNSGTHEFLILALCFVSKQQSENEPAKKKRRTTKKKAAATEEEEEEEEDHEATESEGEESASDFEEPEKPSKKRKTTRRPKKSRTVESDNEDDDEGEKENNSNADKDEEQPAAEPEEECTEAKKEEPETEQLDADVRSKVREIIASGNAEELTVKKSKRETPEPEVAALEPEVAAAVKQQVQNQSASGLADVFASSAASFGKKASYAPAVKAETEERKEAKEVKDKKKDVVDGNKKEKKEKKKAKKEKKKQEQEQGRDEHETETEEEKSQETETEVEKSEGEKEAAEEEAGKADDGEKKKKNKKQKKKKSEEADEETEPAIEDEKMARTVFVGNVSLDATQKDIKNHFSVCGKVESVRLRHLPIAGCAVGEAGNQKLMMKVCANKKILTTAKDNCNAYVIFSEESSVEAALKLNGTKIRVDRGEPVIDAGRSVFIGNVPFKCTDEQMVLFFTRRLRTEEEPEPIENVRLIRDRESGLGKGFGYLLLKSPALVAKTLALRNLKMETRELRVQVCGKRFKNKRGEETTKEKFEGLRASAGAKARIQLKRKAGIDNLNRGVATKKMKRAAAAAGLGKKLKPKHAARKAAKAAAEAAAAAAKGNGSKKRKHDHSDSKKADKPKSKKPKHAARKAEKAAKAKK